jgi:uncharacterized membrane protein
MTESDTPATSGSVAQAASTPPKVRYRAVLRELSPGDPFIWVKRGFFDLMAAPFISYFFGLAFCAMGWMLSLLFTRYPEYTMSGLSGCLLVGPFMAMGLYEVSRRKAEGLPQDLGIALTCWEKHIGSMGLLLLVLMLLELLWGRASLVVFAVFFNTGMPTTTAVLDAVFNPQNWEFVAAYLCVGGVFAGLVFAFMAVSIPMILDRDLDAITAALTSASLVFQNPGVMLLWGGVIVFMMTLALLPYGMGVIAVGPWLGHATWHAYKHAVSWEEVMEEERR